MPVEPLSHPGQKQAAGGQRAAVGADRGDGGGVFSGVQPHAVHGGGDLAGSHGLHSIVLPAPHTGALSIFVYSGMYSKLLLRYRATGLV